MHTDINDVRSLPQRSHTPNLRLAAHERSFAIAGKIRVLREALGVMLYCHRYILCSPPTTAGDGKKSIVAALRGCLHRMQGLLERDPAKRLTAAQALEYGWVREGGSAPTTPLEGTVVQRLQRHATYGHLKQARPFCLRRTV